MTYLRINLKTIAVNLGPGASFKFCGRTAVWTESE